MHLARKLRHDMPVLEAVNNHLGARMAGDSPQFVPVCLLG
jgi:hypothetical protein